MIYAANISLLSSWEAFNFFFFFFTVVPFFRCNIWYHLASLLLILEKNITQKTSTKYKRIVIVSILYMRLRGETASLVSMRIEERNERRRPNLLYVNLRIKIFINSLRSFFLAVRGAKRKKRKKNRSIAKSTTTKRERALWKKRL